MRHVAHAFSPSAPARPRARRQSARRRRSASSRRAARRWGSPTAALRARRGQGRRGQLELSAQPGSAGDWQGAAARSEKATGLHDPPARAVPLSPRPSHPSLSGTWPLRPLGTGPRSARHPLRPAPARAGSRAEQGGGGASMLPRAAERGLRLGGCLGCTLQQRPPPLRACSLPGSAAPAHRGTQLEAKVSGLRSTRHTRVTVCGGERTGRRQASAEHTARADITLEAAEGRRPEAPLDMSTAHGPHPPLPSATASSSGCPPSREPSMPAGVQIRSCHWEGQATAGGVVWVAGASAAQLAGGRGRLPSPARCSLPPPPVACLCGGVVIKQGVEGLAPAGSAGRGGAPTDV